MIVDPKKYSLFDYESKDIENNYFRLGDVVINDRNEIGVIIQLYEISEGDVRTDMFGNYSVDKLRIATDMEIMRFRHELFRYKVFCDMTSETYHTNSLPEAKQKALNLEANIYDQEAKKVIFSTL